MNPSGYKNHLVSLSDFIQRIGWVAQTVLLILTVAISGCRSPGVEEYPAKSLHNLSLIPNECENLKLKVFRF